MPRHPLFDISPEQVAVHDDEGLRLLIARLCVADLKRWGLLRGKRPILALLYRRWFRADRLIRRRGRAHGRGL